MRKPISDLADDSKIITHCFAYESKTVGCGYSAGERPHRFVVAQKLLAFPFVIDEEARQHFHKNLVQESCADDRDCAFVCFATFVE